MTPDLERACRSASGAPRAYGRGVFTLPSTLPRFPRSLSVVKGSTASRTTCSDSAATSLRAGPALIHPFAHPLDEFGIAHRRRGAAIARRPTPFHQRSLEVIDDTAQTLSTVV